MPAMRYIVHDTDMAVEFYTSTLGFSVEERWGPAFAIVSRDGLQLWLSGPQTSAAQVVPDGSKPGPGGWNRLVIEVENIDSLINELRTKNVRFRNDIITGPGGSQVLIEDPSGNPIELFQSRG